MTCHGLLSRRLGVCGVVTRGRYRSRKEDGRCFSARDALSSAKLQQAARRKTGQSPWHRFEKRVLVPPMSASRMAVVEEVAVMTNAPPR